MERRSRRWLANSASAKLLIHRWRKQYHGVSPQEAKRIKELEKENARLKKLLAEKELDIDMLKEVSRGNF